MVKVCSRGSSERFLPAVFVGGRAGVAPVEWLGDVFTPFVAVLEAAFRAVLPTVVLPVVFVDEAAGVVLADLPLAVLSVEAALPFGSDFAVLVFFAPEALALPLDGDLL